MKKKKHKAINWYIKGEYHCDKCPFGWDDYSEYLGDGDCGCYIFGDLRETCRLIPPIRFILGWGKRKKMQYLEAHRYDCYDDYPEWMEEQNKQRKEFNDAIKEHIFDHYAVYFKDCDGEVYGNPIDAGCFCDLDNAERFRWECENIFSSPKEFVPLRKRWVNLIKDTWHGFIGIFKPYFCK